MTEGSSHLPERDSRAGDTTVRWRESYSRVRKDLLRGNDATNRERLRILGFDRLQRDCAILDVGAGDGNLFLSLKGLGFTNYRGFEYQPQLAALHPGKDRIVVASGTHIPYATASVDAVVVMDVLHHLTQAQLPDCLREMRRVLRPGGLLFVCEPANTLFRKTLAIFLFSPLGKVLQFTRDKRAMVEEERATLEPWLETEHAISERICAGGFLCEALRRRWLHHFGRFRAV